MKLNYKIFLLVFFLVVITEFTIGLLIIYFSHDNNVNLYIENCKKEHNNIRNIIFTETSKLQSYRDSSIDYNRSYIDNNKIMPQSIATICYDIANNYKNNQMPTSSLKNMGIGLTLCQEIARLHHGKLTIKNNKNKNGVTSIFYFA